MDSAQHVSRRSVGQWIATIVLGLLSVAFFFRTLQFAFKGLRHVVEADKNFRALTVWALIYTMVCAGLATFAYFMPLDGKDEASEKENPTVD